MPIHININNNNEYWIIIILLITLLILSNYKKIQSMIIIIALILFIIFIILFAYKKHKISNIIDNINDNNYDVIIIDNFLSDKECDQLIEYSKSQNFVTSETIGDYGSVTTDYRKSQQIWITDNNAIANKISNFCSSLSVGQ